MKKSNLFPILLVLLVMLGAASVFIDWSSTPKTTSEADGSQSTASNSVSPESVMNASIPDTIPWFSGSIDDAFAHARQTNKPLFLYWGAIWCPPCEQIKQTVFIHPTFLALTESFVPVYLDGDTERAQTWGEHFAVAGYPTMILFSPQGQELTRIPGGIDTQHYIDVFQVALNGLKNTTELLTLALTSPEKLGAGDFTQLAFYSWEQSNLPEGVVADADTFKQLANNAQAANNSIAFSRLYFHYLNQIFLEEDESAFEFGAAEKTQAYLTVLNILAEGDQVLANIDYMVFYAQDFVPMITDPGEHRQNLTQAWVSAMDAVRFSESLSSAEQLATWYPQLYLYWINDPEAQSLPEVVQQQVLAHIDEMDKATQGDARQTVINKSYQVLQAARLYDASRQVLLREIEKSHSPYYFMSGLASLEEELGNKPQAVEWLQRAYNESKGVATRFQWGVEYVDGLARMAPQQNDTIVTTTQGLLNELDKPTDVFSGRNFGRLNTLLSVLNHWQEETGEQPGVNDFKSRLVELCAEVEPGTTASVNCSGLEI